MTNILLTAQTAYVRVYMVLATANGMAFFNESITVLQTLVIALGVVSPWKNSRLPQSRLRDGKATQAEQDHKTKEKNMTSEH